MSDSHPDLPQHFLTGLAYRRAKRRNRGRGVEIKNAQKILVFKVILRGKPAAGHEGVSGTDSGSVAERRTDIEIVVFLQKRAVNGIKDVAAVFLPVVIGKLGSNRSKLSRKVALRPDTKPAFKGIRNGLEMLRFVVPKVGAAGIFPAARVCHVEDISQPWSFTVGMIPTT